MALTRRNENRPIMFWTIQIMLNLSLLYFICDLVLEIKTLAISVPILTVLYFGYLMINIGDSPYIKFLRQIENLQSIDEIMTKVFTNPPQLAYRASCYHLVETTSYVDYGEGNRQYNTTNERKETFSEKVVFPFYSWRDISGPFDLEKGKNSHKLFINLFLNLKFEIDTGNFSELEQIKKSLEERNKDKDDYIEVTREDTIEGYREQSIVKIKKEGGYKTINSTFFYIFTVLAVVEFYNLYVNYFCIEKEFNIVKVISQTQDLNSKNFDEVYKDKKPILNVLNNSPVAFDYFTPSSNNQQDVKNKQSNDLSMLSNKKMVNIGEGEGASKTEDKVSQFNIEIN